MESDRLEEIFIDEFSVRVCGDYTYYPDAVPTEYVDISEKRRSNHKRYSLGNKRYRFMDFINIPAYLQ